jgi:hypothetical protein
MSPLRRASIALFSSVAAVIALAPTRSDAHFRLETPAAALDQDQSGNPQKAPPCGEDATATQTGMITTYQAGTTVTITLNETIYHPGHYRVAIAPNDPSELPEEPPVTAGSTACGSTTIMDPPVYPVLADGELLHDAPFDGPQTIEVTLPDDLECEHCTLQIIQFMSNHGLNNPGGCFYHHCATIAVQAEPVMTTSATSSSAATTGPGGGRHDDDGPGHAGVGRAHRIGRWLRVLRRRRKPRRARPRRPRRSRSLGARAPASSSQASLEARAR